MTEFKANPEGPEQSESGKFQTGKVVNISLAHLSHDVYSAFLAPLLPLLITKLNLSLSAVAILDIARKIPQLLNPLIGLIADRLSSKSDDLSLQEQLRWSQ